MKTFTLLAPLALLGACATVDNSPVVDNGPASEAGTAVALGEPVWAGHVVATPKAVIEDSRCPINARCIRAGKLIVATRIDGPGWRQTVNLTLGEPHTVQGATVALVSGEPGRMAGEETDPLSYRFVYEAR